MVNRYLLFSRLFDKTLFIYLTISLQPIPLAKQVLCYYKQKRGAETLKIYNFLKKDVLFLPHAYPFNLNSGKKLDTHTHTRAVCAVSCPALCDSMDCSPPCSFVRGVFQTRLLEWIAISFSRISSQHRDRTHISCICR